MPRTFNDGRTRKRTGDFEAKTLDERDDDRYTVRTMIINGRHRCSWQTDRPGSCRSLSNSRKLPRLAGQPGCPIPCGPSQLVQGRCVSSGMGADEPFIGLMSHLCVLAGPFALVAPSRCGRCHARQRGCLDVCYKPASSISATSPSADKAATIRWRCSLLLTHSEETLYRRRVALTGDVPSGLRTPLTGNSIAHTRMVSYAQFTAYRLRDGGSWSSSDSSHADQAKSWPTPTPSAIQLGSRSTDA